MKKYTRLSKPQTMALAFGVLASGGAFGITGIPDFTFSDGVDSVIVEQSDSSDISSFNDDYGYIQGKK